MKTVPAPLPGMDTGDLIACAGLIVVVIAFVIWGYGRSL